ncbi:hypothetical protein GAQ35_19660 [Bacteroides uniformis]|uniref:Uncharacterized protein n=1 Tax=Bacteroides uniformis TaxID=820 RepID=A0A6A2FXT4_BACUN|nr:hypothetical protein GAQ36_19745 [Bacteroides uniformis]KAB4387870.1 hypothetical protein GAO29_29825 [Bacteroides thetaiotaomicron]KAB4120063.1 hypothetical protein GAQ50_19925 [Bacteroides uniformis]KAB4124680.1 hypothetical protein GAQ33_19980 [Bacteroides uniformis]KAB4130566.1 hypothetical protein GAQ40_19560 [Bacteroides uniformis]
MNKRHYEHTLPNIRGSLSNTYHIAGGGIRNMVTNVRNLCTLKRATPFVRDGVAIRSKGCSLGM